MALTKQTVVRTALELLDEVGLDGLTLRKLAAKLNVQAPALYWHFANKQALLDEMATTMLADSLRTMAPQQDELSWETWARTYGSSYRRMLLEHRDGAKMFSGTYLTDRSLYEPMETVMAMFARVASSIEEAVIGLTTINSYVVGFVIEEQAVYPKPGERNDQYDPTDRARRVGDELPLTQAAGEHMFSDPDRRFARGLDLIIRGMQATYEPAHSAD
ncbi:TetR/AcrR family transcriptional regulator C-terminal domain-containing protein [Tenggerimyces flavus]|uniref:TetR/AcrR family transcriptional regulator C-terminal domain-containing protein n=1 Tax=Tenggerimyces flavus TaxID=1708749 RepID=A0ABV7Y8I6_9ACTN|nr:TetR/AcrR family transcriptional regulator C-terminal domain-containing protein [Tenggerimyces flavus]MBM7791168.1 AcrR family transcriptional regulator [Tenggerimyces flavus]